MNEPKPLPSETKLVETPRTDEVVSMRGLGEMVPAEFARQLEHELASLADELRRTKAELDCAQENFHVTNQAYVKADDELRLAREALHRLGSMEAFKGPRAVNEHDAELLARIEFARAAMKEPR